MLSDDAGVILISGWLVKPAQQWPISRPQNWLHIIFIYETSIPKYPYLAQSKKLTGACNIIIEYTSASDIVMWV